MRTSIPGIAECYPFFSTVLIFYWERVHFVHVSEIINYGKIKKNMVIWLRIRASMEYGGNPLSGPIQGPTRRTGDLQALVGMMRNTCVF